MEEMRKATGIRTLAISENGYRHFVTSKKQVKSVSDMKGLKIRTMENPAHMKMVEVLGGFGAFVEKPEDIRPALEAAFACGKTACINVKVDAGVISPGSVALANLGGYKCN